MNSFGKCIEFKEFGDKSIALCVIKTVWSTLYTVQVYWMCNIYCMLGCTGGGNELL